MRTLNRPTILALIAVTLLSPFRAFGWSNYINCDGTPGTAPPQGGAGQFTDPFTLTQYSSAEAANGKGSCKLGITAGSDGWGQWGATYTFPSHVPSGSAVWVRVSLYAPTGFPIKTNDGFLKFMRVHTLSPSNSNEGYHDLLLANPGFIGYSGGHDWAAPAPYIYNFEGDANLVAVGTVPANNFVYNTWQTFEIYIKFDSVPKASGGQGEVRVWVNNKLLLDNTNEPTLVTSSSFSDAFYLFTYWNGNAPATTSVYVDDITITSDTPSGRDANGNPYIGGPQPGGGTSQPPPSVPAAPALTIH